MSDKNDHFGPFYTILALFKPFSMGTLSKMMGNIRILAKALILHAGKFDHSDPSVLHYTDTSLSLIL